MRAVAIEKSIRPQIKAHPETCDSSPRAVDAFGDANRRSTSRQHRSAQRTNDWDLAVAGTDVVRQLCGDAVVTVV
jgi:hypothetical protein